MCEYYSEGYSFVQLMSSVKTGFILGKEIYFRNPNTWDMEAGGLKFKAALAA